MTQDEKIWSNFYGKQNILVKGETLSGKTENAIKRYKYLIEKEGIKSHEVLVILLNRQAVSYWKKNLDLEYMASLKIKSYFGFIQEELKKNWIVILEEFNGVKIKKLEPVFMNFESSQCLMTKTIEYYRDRGRLKGVIAEDEALAVKFHSNIVKSSLAGINYSQSGKRLAKINPVNHEIYKDMNLINRRYIEKCLERGVLDYATAIYIYNKYLLKNREYIESLKNRVKTVIVDNFELADSSMCNLMNILLKEINYSRFYYNTDGKFSLYMQGGYSIEKLSKKLKAVEIRNEKNRFSDFTDRVKESILYNRILDKKDEKIALKRFEYKEELYRKIREIIDTALEKGKSLSVISPVNDIILEYVLKKYIESKGESFNILSRKTKILDDRNTYILFIMTQLIYRYSDFMLNEDEVQNFFEFLFKENPVRIKLLIKRVFNFKNQSFNEINYKDRVFVERIGMELIEKYSEFLNCLEDYIEKKDDVDIILKKFYMEFLLFDTGVEELSACKNLIDLASNFVEVISNFELIKDYNYEFIKFIRQGAKAAETMYELEEKVGKNRFILSTPSKYLSSDKKTDLQVWTDIQSIYWDLNYINEFENPLIYSEEFSGDEGYESELEFKKENIINTSRRIIKRAGEQIYFFVNKSSEDYEASLLYEILKGIEN